MVLTLLVGMWCFIFYCSLSLFSILQGILYWICNKILFKQLILRFTYIFGVYIVNQRIHECIVNKILKMLQDFRRFPNIASIIWYYYFKMGVYYYVTIRRKRTKLFSCGSAAKSIIIVDKSHRGLQQSTTFLCFLWLIWIHYPQENITWLIHQEKSIGYFNKEKGRVSIFYKLS